jgi:hypothetical protein
MAANNDDARSQDSEYDPEVEPSSAKAWLNLLQESEDAFERWNGHCDRIDKQFASLERLSQSMRDKEFQMFWANCEVLKPAIYAKPPIPVVVPKFKDRRPIYQAAAEVVERCATVAFDLARIDELMLLVRDDVALIGRGVAWCRYESGGKGSYYKHERVCIDFKNRRDFLHSISRTWPEVTWVAAASYLTRSEARERFEATSGDAYEQAEYRVDKEAKGVGGADNRERAKFWEIWDKGSERVVWVAKGCEDILDEDDPHLDLLNFFPCPKPAYGALQRGSLVPVPDVMQYKDQLEEMNLLTGRIHALSDALEAKGFYPAGGAEIADAVETAIKLKTPGRVLVPISNWAAFGGSKEVILWLPIDMIAQTITALVALRKQVIDDVYQIMGLSDIMRGATDPGETLGAQELKTQYGATRIRDKQQELVRLARDLVEIVAEIITEKFKPVTIIEMSQTQLPTQQMQQRQIAQIQGQMQQVQLQIQQAQQNPQVMQMAQQNPGMLQQVKQQAEQLLAQGSDQIAHIAAQPNIEQVLRFLKDNRSKSFVLDIETDSTIQANENAEKQRRSEFVGVLSQLLPQLAQMIQAQPKTAEFCGELLKFATAPFRAGRSLDGAIDDLVQQMQALAGQNQQTQTSPQEATAKVKAGIEQMKLEYQKQKDAQDQQLKQTELALKAKQAADKNTTDRAIAAAQMAADQRAAEQKAQETNQKMMHDREMHQQEIIKGQQELVLNAQKGQIAQQQSETRAADLAQRAQERRDARQFRQGGLI